MVRAKDAEDAEDAKKTREQGDKIWKIIVLWARQLQKQMDWDRHISAEGIFMREDEIAKIVIQNAFEIHKELGSGLLESVYEALLAALLIEQGLTVERQKIIPLTFRDLQFDEGFRADLVIENLVLLELKAVTALVPVHKKQVLTYLKLSNLKLGLLINFGGEFLKDNIERLVNKLDNSSAPVRRNL